MRLGDMLKYYRLMTDLTHEQLARQIGISTIILYNLEDGQTPSLALWLILQNWILGRES